MTHTYLLDTNIFIEAKNNHYGFDFCPAFWDWLILQNQNGKVGSVKAVWDEINQGEDNLSEWVRDLGKPLFFQPDQKVIEKFGPVSEWLSEQNYDQGAINTFLQKADYWLVAHALAYDFTVVTRETPDNSRKVKIPEVCIGMGIECINPYNMLRREQARFVLGS